MNNEIHMNEALRHLLSKSKRKKTSWFMYNYMKQIKFLQNIFNEYGESLYQKLIDDL